MKSPWTHSDPLGDALQFLRMSGVFYGRSELTAPWALTMPVLEDCVMFHTVAVGRCWLEIPGMKAQQLRVGDVILVPHGVGHKIFSGSKQRAIPLLDLPREQVSERFEILRHGGGGESCILICGVVQFDHPVARRLLALLPKLLVIDATREPHSEWLHTTLRLMAAEAASPKMGGETVITRLADILVIQAIRSWIAREGAAQIGWLTALQDKQVGKIIALIHRQPEQAWSVAKLARAASMSRSAFAARFTRLVGESAMQYVTRCRMQAAFTRVKESTQSLATISSDLGYRSEAAFHRAFKRFNGVVPGTIRGKRRTGGVIVR